MSESVSLTTHRTVSNWLALHYLVLWVRWCSGVGGCGSHWRHRVEFHDSDLEVVEAEVSDQGLFGEFSILGHIDGDET